jgi:predicted nucleic acid-binding protein
MTQRLLIDTDILVDFLRGFPKAVKLLKTHSEDIIISAITVAELYAGVRDDERRHLDDLISLFEVIPISREIGETGGLFKQQYHQSHGVGLADAIIAATSVNCDAELKTLNTRHFPMIKGLRAPYLKI